MYISRNRRVFASDEADVSVDAGATDLLFETQDVADLISNVTGEDVEVTVEDDVEDGVTFAVGNDEYTVTPDGDEEILESTRVRRNKRSVRANRRPASRRRPIKSNRRPTAKRNVRASRTRTRRVKK